MNVRSISSMPFQRGAATVLIVLMLGLAISVSVAATVFSLRGTQASVMTLHASTAAQAAAWRGVETLRRFFLQLDDAQIKALPGQEVRGMASLGIRKAVVTAVTGASAPYRVKVEVTGEAGEGSAMATATVEAVYAITPGSGSPGTPPICHTQPGAPMVFNGDLTASGGSIGVEDPNAQWNYRDIVVTGNLDLHGGSAARVSGCIKGNVTISGGGVTDHGHLYSEGDIKVTGMGNPTGASLWARNVSIPSGTAGGSFNVIKAGAWHANVMNGSLIVGTAEVSGHLLDDPADLDVPRTTGTVIPLNGDKVVITLNDGTRYLLDIGQASVDATTGRIVVGSAAELLDEHAPAGHAVLPTRLVFEAIGIYAGDVIYQTTTPVTTMWGHDVSLGDSNSGDARVASVWVNGNLSVGHPTISELLGGGNLYAKLASGSGYPQFTGTGEARLVGDAYKGMTHQLSASDALAFMAPLAVRQSDASPGLPGVPWCEAKINPIDADNFKADANYVYELVGGEPRLTIQHVMNKSTGQIINGETIALSNPTQEQLDLLKELMVCNWTNDKGCLNVWDANNNRWKVTGGPSLPPGVFWFDRDLFLGGGNTFNNTLVVAGSLELKDAGTNKLTAPNLGNVADVCGADYYPGNLCADESAFKTWCDVAVPSTSTSSAQCPAANLHIGLPLGNMAVISEGTIGGTGAKLAGWTITGNVVLGGSLDTSGGGITIVGTLSVGMNQKSATTVTSGGLTVTVPSNGSNSSTMPFCSTGTIPAHVPASASVLWSRYR